MEVCLSAGVDRLKIICQSGSNVGSVTEPKNEDSL